MYDRSGETCRESLFLKLFRDVSRTYIIAYLRAVDIGVWNRLRLDRFTSVGAYLVDKKGNDVLLPNKYVKDEYKEEDEIEVFLYKDSEDRLVATTREPFIQLGEFAYLQVVEVTIHGAFMDWGLEKDLLVPFREQPKEMEEGRYYLVYLYLDEATQRLAATARVNPFYEAATEELVQRNEEVVMLVCETTELGIKVIVNNRFRGLIFQSDVTRKLKYGSIIDGFVKNVREDGKLDIILQPEGYGKVEPLSQELLDLIQQKGGFISLTDKSDPADIQKMTGWSKKTFKQVVGNLYKQRLVVIGENGITLTDN